ncbi:zinc-ribbon domain-containing protein [Spirillospora sp. CA-294931]|uniref:zinc-ribbon domain-containing protein n=1 Tax=Spirillospora sp. CA-294931 TaxID=3240042 RepID=UPI003D903B1E
MFFRTISEGTFHCQQCGGDRTYRHRSGRRFFTLFFLPVMPLNSVGEVVECRTCKTRFTTSVLQAPTSQQLAAALPAGMRASVSLVLRAGDPSDAAARRYALELVRGYGERGYDENAINTDLNLAPAYLHEEVSRAGGQLAVEAKEWFLAQVVRVGLADGPLTDGERQAVHQVAQSLGMSQAHALGVISTTEGASR